MWLCARSLDRTRVFDQRYKVHRRPIHLSCPIQWYMYVVHVHYAYYARINLRQRQCARNDGAPVALAFPLTTRDERVPFKRRALSFSRAPSPAPSSYDTHLRYCRHAPRRDATRRDYETRRDETEGRSTTTETTYALHTYLHLYAGILVISFYRVSRKLRSWQVY